MTGFLYVFSLQISELLLVMEHEFAALLQWRACLELLWHQSSACRSRLTDHTIRLNINHQYADSPGT